MAIWISGISGAINMEQRGEVAMSSDPQGFPKIGPPVVLSGQPTPCFLVTVDTEEEFDWSAPFSRTGHGVTHLSSIEPFQKLCERFGVTPVYLVDYPVAQDDFGAEFFAGLVGSGVAEVGLQLHPWVTPPFDEEVNVHNSYACNLAPDLERTKLFRLFEIVEKKLGCQPDSYRAGRYGAGAHTPGFLAELGIRVDTSVRSLFDYRQQGGPNYARCPLTPYWVQPGSLLELPVTSLFGGLFRSMGPLLFDQVFGSETMRSALARSGMLERIALTPEGIPADKAIEAIDLAIDDGLPVLTFSFHSPSLAVGHTPYVRTEQQLELFYSWWEQVFTHLQKRSVKPSSIADITAAAFPK